MARGTRPQLQHLAVLIRVSAPELVDAVEVVRRDDEAVELAQVTPVSIHLAVHAVLVHCALTPDAPEEEQNCEI